MLREVVKWDYELRDGRQLAAVLDRARAIAATDPKGPVYLTLPREVLASPYDVPAVAPGVLAPATGPGPDAGAVEALADRLSAAELPVMVVSATGADPVSVELLADFCERYAVGITEAEPGYFNVSADHVFHLGYRPEQVLADADVVCVLASDVPWIPAHGSPRPDAFVAHGGVDPLFARYPMRSHRSDLAITATTTSLLLALGEAMEARSGRIDATRAGRLGKRSAGERDRVDRIAERELSQSGPITKAFMSLTLADVLGDDTVLFNEYWVIPQLLRPRRPGSYFYLPPASGLGWALPAALGAKHARPERTVIAAVGDGAYLFANPAACHHASLKHELPVLTIVANNAGWGAVDHATHSVYPEGQAVRTGERRLSDLSPSPAFERYAEASGGYGEAVTSRDELRPALDRALHAVQTEGRQALLNVSCA